jgi:hypothetical protein
MYGIYQFIGSSYSSVLYFINYLSELMYVNINYILISPYSFVSSCDGVWCFGCVTFIFYGFWNCILEETEGFVRILLSSGSAGCQLEAEQFISYRQFAGNEFCVI